MSETILKALTQLFAIITKQDGGPTEMERAFVTNYFKQELDSESILTYTDLYDQVSEYGKPQEVNPMSVKESVRILKFCREINKSLEQRQKVIILIKLLELVAAAPSHTKMHVINTVSSAFNIKDDYNMIEGYILNQDSTNLNFQDILVASSSNALISPEAKFYKVDNLQGEIIFLRVKSVDLYFVKYIGDDDVKLNGFAMNRNQVYLFNNGSSIKTLKGSSIYYGDIVSLFLENLQSFKLSFTAKNIEYKFVSGTIGVRDVNVSENQGKLIGIMGGSGAGKTTLMNVLSGIEKPSKGAVYINGINIHEEKDKIEGVIGYIAQDDLLIEELTVYQNLYYNAKLCFKHLSETAIHERVMKTLSSLGLDHIKDLKVGNVLNKKISGGQRKRLNIALELIREPAVMFVDEPTSGLSSKDSRNVIDLLKELSIKGQLIFVIIHQPSPDIYKTFDKMIILDKGGYLVFYGPPIEAITYFKKETNQADSNKWSDNPEEMFNIIEKEVVDEYGQETGKRQLSPKDWQEKFINNEQYKFDEVEPVNEQPPSSLNRPNIFKQTYIFTIRDFLAKISNTQYMLINLLEAPVLALLLSYIIRFAGKQNNDEYIFRYNDNIPAYVLICIIISLFMGLTVSAEEIIKDKKIKKRETFLNLSHFSYLASKIIILFLLSAVQTFTFVLVGNAILGIQGEWMNYWIVLFSVSCFANVLGLNISSTFNSVITIYITIPLLLIPQLILSGIIFRYEKMNQTVTSVGKVPFVADLMTSRWAFEAICVNQFKNNTYNIDFYQTDKKEAINNFKALYWTQDLTNRLNNSYNQIDKLNSSDSLKKAVQKDLNIIRNEIKTNNEFMDLLDGVDLDKSLKAENFDLQITDRLRTYLDTLKNKYQQNANDANKRKEDIVNAIREKRDSAYNQNKVKDQYHNDYLEKFVRNQDIPDFITRPLKVHNERLVQQTEMIYNDPKNMAGFLDYRAHFMAPRKHFAGVLFDTYYFNIAVVWFLTLVFYITLYFDFFKRLIDFFANISFKKKNT